MKQWVCCNCNGARVVHRQTRDIPMNGGQEVVVLNHTWCETCSKTVAAKPIEVDGLAALIAEVEVHDADLNRREVPPTGDDYNDLYAIVQSYKKRMEG